jgi:hypothetical protein
VVHPWISSNCFWVLQILIGSLLLDDSTRLIW